MLNVILKYLLIRNIAIRVYKRNKELQHFVVSDFIKGSEHILFKVLIEIICLNTCINKPIKVLESIVEYLLKIIREFCNILNQLVQSTKIKVIASSYRNNFTLYIYI